jgi:hypothetical protein
VSVNVQPLEIERMDCSRHCSGFLCRWTA